MAYDLVIRNGTVIDGKGTPRFSADVAVQNGKIAAIGKIDGTAKKTIAAAGKIVCPGFVDPHTHYDAQITWDQLLSSSSEHGVTTVMMGNCGVGIAPCRPAVRGLLTEDLVTVEGIDHEGRAVTTAVVPISFTFMSLKSIFEITSVRFRIRSNCCALVFTSPVMEMPK